MLKSWIEQKKFMNNSSRYKMKDVEHFLDETYTKMDNIPGLKTALFPHQKTVIRAMIDLENTREFELYQPKTIYDKTIKDTFITKVSAGVLSEAVGSGKTIDILSVILLQKHPKIYPDISSLILNKNITCSTSKIKYSCIIRKKFRRILKPTIVFVGVSVVNQWINAIKTFTSLKYIAIFDVRGLQKLINMIVDKSINEYDIVIIKNGKVSRCITFPDDVIVEDKNLNKSNISIYNTIANMRKYSWTRVVIDDFDTIKLPYNAGIVNGLFTWYISSTRKSIVNREINNTQFKTTSDMLMYSNYNCANIMNNPILFYNLNIRNTPKFVEETNNIDSAKFYVYLFDNPNDQYMGFLNLLGSNDAREVMEMLNGDAIETAAEKIGIKTNKVADIFQIMMGKQYDLYRKSVNVLEFINEVEPMQGNRLPMSHNTDLEDTYKKSDLFIRREIKYNYPNLKNLLDTTKEEYTEIKQRTGISIERVKNNIKEGDCPICMGELNDEDEEILIIKCCGIILCGVCCFGTVFPKNSTLGQCSNCRTKLTLYDLIYLNKGFDLTKIVNEDEDEDEDEIQEVNEPVAIIKPIDKITAVINIINGITIPEKKRVDVSIPNLMKGNKILPAATYHKVLIFANFEETLKKTVKRLIDENIKFWKLSGTHSEINRTQEKFNNCEETCALVINSMSHCSGLNLQSATDLIFLHKIIDVNTETQVIGRGQRLGRLSTLNVYYLLYNNEYAWMTSSNNMREIDDV